MLRVVDGDLPLFFRRSPRLCLVGSCGVCASIFNWSRDYLESLMLGADGESSSVLTPTDRILLGSCSNSSSLLSIYRIWPIILTSFAFVPRADSIICSLLGLRVDLLPRTGSGGDI